MKSRHTKISPNSGRGLGHVTSTIFGSTVGYPSESLASCVLYYNGLLMVLCIAGDLKGSADMVAASQ